MLYQIQEGNLSLDGAWQDQSVNVLVPARVSVKGANLVVTREILPLGMGLDDYVAQQRQSFRKQMADFKALLDVSGDIDGRPAKFLEFTWSNDSKPLHQMVMVVEHEGRVLIFTASIPGTADTGTREFLLDAIRGFKFGAAGVSA